MQLLQQLESTGDTFNHSVKHSWTPPSDQPPSRPRSPYTPNHHFTPCASPSPEIPFYLRSSSALPSSPQPQGSSYFPPRLSAIAPILPLYRHLCLPKITHLALVYKRVRRTTLAVELAWPTAKSQQRMPPAKNKLPTPLGPVASLGLPYSETNGTAIHIHQCPQLVSPWVGVTFSTGI